MPIRNRLVECAITGAVLGAIVLSLVMLSLAFIVMPHPVIAIYVLLVGVFYGVPLGAAIGVARALLDDKKPALAGCVCLIIGASVALFLGPLLIRMLPSVGEALAFVLIFYGAPILAAIGVMYYGYRLLGLESGR